MNSMIRERLEAEKEKLIASIITSMRESIDTSVDEVEYILLDERDRCEYIVQAVYDQLVDVKHADSDARLSWINMLHELDAALRKIQNGKPPNPYWKPSTQTKE